MSRPMTTSMHEDHLTAISLKFKETFMTGGLYERFRRTDTLKRQKSGSGI